MHLWNEYRGYVLTAAVRDHMGVSVDEWEDLPAELVEAAIDFYGVEHQLAAKRAPNPGKRR